jgi:glycosyltransferase involved in cell wall biosynthesis
MEFGALSWPRPIELMLAVIETHPIQYHAPVWRHLEQVCDVPVTAIYGADFSVTGYRDAEFGTSFAWDTDLLSGYTTVFLSRQQEGGAKNNREVKADGLSAALQRSRASAILTVGYSPRFHMDAFRCARKTGLPLLFRGETTDHARTRGRIRNWVRDLTLRWMYRQCSAIAYVGKRSAEHFRRLGMESRARFFSPYCVDTIPFQTEENARSELRASARQDLGLGASDWVIMFCGKLSPRKAPDLLISAARNCASTVKRRVVLLLVGDGELAEQLQRQAAVKPELCLRRVGFQQQRALSRYYHAADVMVLPSLRGETWGLVVNEALHHGVPVVVSDAVGCAPDLVELGQTGEVCVAGSVPDLTAALLRVSELADSPQTRMCCREKASRYTVARAAEGLAAAYRSAIRKDAPVL